jgi:hypothetical protein
LYKNFSTQILNINTTSNDGLPFALDRIAQPTMRSIAKQSQNSGASVIRHSFITGAVGSSTRPTYETRRFAPRNGALGGNHTGGFLRF